MVCRLFALRCFLALGLLVPRVAAAEPPTDAGAQTPAASEEPEDPEAQPEDASEEPDDAEAQLDDADADEDAATEDDAPAAPYPERLPRLQRIGWYHVLGAFTLGTTAGLLAGLAEREEDRATRIAAGYDYDTGSAVLYSERQDQYERILDRGRAFETSAIVLGALAGATTIAAITLFAVDARRRGKPETARRTRIGPGSVEVRF